MSSGISRGGRWASSTATSLRTTCSSPSRVRPRCSTSGSPSSIARCVETEVGTVKGKLRYMAPEQIRGDVLDRRADVYAAGVILWEALAGERMWKGVGDAEIRARVGAGDLPPPPSRIRRAAGAGADLPQRPGPRSLPASGHRAGDGRRARGRPGGARCARHARARRARRRTVRGVAAEQARRGRGARRPCGGRERANHQRASTGDGRGDTGGARPGGARRRDGACAAVARGGGRGGTD